MNYYLDTEFVEGLQDYGNPSFEFFIGDKQPKKPTIDLISIGIVKENNDSYYAISKDFNLKEAWNRTDEKVTDDINPKVIKVHWLREKVIWPIFDYLYEKSQIDSKYLEHHRGRSGRFTYWNVKHLINYYGKTNNQIRKDLINFILDPNQKLKNKLLPQEFKQFSEKVLSLSEEKPKFYGYYCDYDWVVFCWLFGKMIDLPKQFPKYCIDLKQIKDEKQKSIKENFDSMEDYPKLENKHNALIDAIWIKKLHEFLNSYKND